MGSFPRVPDAQISTLQTGGTCGNGCQATRDMHEQKKRETSFWKHRPPTRDYQEELVYDDRGETPYTLPGGRHANLEEKSDSPSTDKTKSSSILASSAFDIGHRKIARTKLEAQLVRTEPPSVPKHAQQTVERVRITTQEAFSECQLGPL